jgi:hypothetical protein
VPLPKVGDEAFVEREGVIAVETAVNEARCLWRETPTRDVGIDGQIEYVDPEGSATGRIVAVQVKSGASYFRDATHDYIPYSPAARHRDYWREFPLPVILALRNPKTKRVHWVDARAELRAGEGPVRVPTAQLLNASGVITALQSEGPLPQTPLPPRALVDLMLSDTEPLSNCNLSFFDLFIQGLTDAASWSLYFSMDLYSEVAHAKQELLEVDFPGLTIAGDSYAFIDRYVSFLVAYDLARVDFDAFRRVAEKAQMVGVILAPLTARGLELVQFVDELDDQIANEWPSRVVRERWLAMQFSDLHERTARIEEFKRRLG